MTSARLVVETAGRRPMRASTFSMISENRAISSSRPAAIWGLSGWRSR